MLLVNERISFLQGISLRPEHTPRRCWRCLRWWTGHSTAPSRSMHSLEKRSSSISGMNPHIHTFIHTYIYTYIYTHAHIHTYIHRNVTVSHLWKAHTYIHIHTHTHTHAHIHTHTHTHTHIHTHINTHTHTHTNALTFHRYNNHGCILIWLKVLCFSSHALHSSEKQLSWVKLHLGPVRLNERGVPGYASWSFEEAKSMRRKPSAEALQVTIMI